jgi:polar amino acid transport system permease protein
MSVKRNGTWIALLVAGGGLLLAGCNGGAASYHWDWGVAVKFLPYLLRGLELSLAITVISGACGVLLGVPVAVGRMSRVWPVRMLTTGYIEAWRGTPVLVQLVWFYYAFPVLVGISMSAVVAATLALTLNMSAFAGEAFRAGIQALSREQLESAEVLGLRRVQRLRYVIVPQAFRNVLPVLISLVVSLFKDTSLVSTLGIADLMYNGNNAATLTYRPLEILTTVAVIYFLVAFPFTLLMRRLEVRLRRHLNPIGVASVAAAQRTSWLRRGRSSASPLPPVGEETSVGTE